MSKYSLIAFMAWTTFFLLTLTQETAQVPSSYGRHTNVQTTELAGVQPNENPLTERQQNPAPKLPLNMERQRQKNKTRPMTTIQNNVTGQQLKHTLMQTSTQANTMDPVVTAASYEGQNQKKQRNQIVKSSTIQRSSKSTETYHTSTQANMLTTTQKIVVAMATQERWPRKNMKKQINSSRIGQPKPTQENTMYSTPKEMEVAAANYDLSDIDLSITATMIEDHLITAWTLSHDDAVHFQGFRVVCMHEGDNIEHDIDKAEHISPILGTALRSYTPVNFQVDGHYTVCVEILLNETYVLNRQCSTVQPHKSSIIVGILAGSIFLAPCIGFVIYILYKDASIQSKRITDNEYEEVSKNHFESTNDSLETKCMLLSPQTPINGKSKQPEEVSATQHNTVLNSQPQTSLVLCAHNGVCPAIAKNAEQPVLASDLNAEGDTEDDELTPENCPMLSAHANLSQSKKTPKITSSLSDPTDTKYSHVDLQALLAELELDLKPDHHLRESIL